MYSSPPPDGLLLRVLGSEQPLYEMLHFMKGELGAEKWAVIFEDGFWWMPHRLGHFVEVFDRNENSEPGEVGYLVPKSFGPGNSASRIRAVREMLLKKGGDYSLLTPTVKAKWTKALLHNWHDCNGMREVMIRCAEKGE
jgi:hypothetical protein